MGQNEVREGSSARKHTRDDGKEVGSDFDHSIFEAGHYPFYVSETSRFSSCKNYGTFPVALLHEIFLFLPLDEFLSFATACKLFYAVFSSNYHWECRYRAHCLMKSPKSEALCWKKRYYESFCCKDRRYHRKYPTLNIFREKSESDKPLPCSYEFWMLIFGLKGSGKSGRISLTVQY